MRQILHRPLGNLEKAVYLHDRAHPSQGRVNVREPNDSQKLFILLHPSKPSISDSLFSGVPLISGSS